MAEFETVCHVGDLEDGASKNIIVGDRILALFRNGDQYHALDDACPHMGFSLVGGAVEDGTVTCPLHAWRFRLEDGSWLSSPRVKVGCYTVRIQGDEVQVEVPGRNKP